MSERENGQLPLAKRTVRNRISSERWEQIKVAYVSGIGLREIARKMKIPEGTVLAHAKRHGWTQQIQVATRELSVMQSDAIAITPVQSVPQSIASILGECRERTKLSLAKYSAKAAKDSESATLRDSPLVHKVAQVASLVWPEEQKQSNILQLGVLIGTPGAAEPIDLPRLPDSEGQDSGA
jgi:hypothetical protein